MLLNPKHVSYVLTVWETTSTQTNTRENARKSKFRSLTVALCDFFFCLVLWNGEVLVFAWIDVDVTVV